MGGCSFDCSAGGICFLLCKISGETFCLCALYCLNDDAASGNDPAKLYWTARSGTFKYKGSGNFAVDFLAAWRGGDVAVYGWSEMEAIEAARLETSSCLRILWHCVLPQLKVYICAVALFLFAENWNLLEQPLLYLNEDSKRNLSIFLVRQKNMKGKYSTLLLYCL